MAGGVDGLLTPELYKIVWLLVNLLTRRIRDEFQTQRWADWLSRCTAVVAELCAAPAGAGRSPSLDKQRRWYCSVRSAAGARSGGSSSRRGDMLPATTTADTHGPECGTDVLFVFWTVTAADVGSPLRPLTFPPFLRLWAPGKWDCTLWIRRDFNAAAHSRRLELQRL